jgi:hypothetical protein
MGLGTANKPVARPLLLFLQRVFIVQPSPPAAAAYWGLRRLAVAPLDLFYQLFMPSLRRLTCGPPAVDKYAALLLVGEVERVLGSAPLCVPV